MKLAFNNTNNPRYKHNYKTMPNGFASSKNNTQPSFRGLPFAKKEVFFPDIDKIAKKIDNILGDNYFSTTAQKAGIELKSSGVKIIKPGVMHDIKSTVRYPFLDMPLDITNWVLTLLKKTPLKDFAQKTLNNPRLLKRAQQYETEKSYKLVLDMLNGFCNGNPPSDINKCAESFKEKVTQGVGKITKKYNARDERTLNRIATSTVSALYSARDFYNISMLEKNDKDEAKKSEKARKKQELTRMAISGALTFFTLGALDKVTKTNVVMNSSVIALSALIAEVVSRVANGTPLHPLSPKEAEKIAKKRKEGKSKLQQQNTKTNTQPSFKSAQFSDENKLYSQFGDKNGKITALNMLNKTQKTASKHKKKQINYKKLLTACFTLASAAYLTKRVIDGEYIAKFKVRNILKADKYDAHALKGTTPFDSDIENKIINAIKQMLKSKKKSDILGRFKTNVTTKEKSVYVQDIINSYEKLKSTQEGKTIANLLDEYIKHAQEMLNKGMSKVEIRTNKFIVPGIYDGFTKIFSTLYRIFSIPGAMINKCMNNLFFDKNKDIFEKYTRQVSNEKIERYKKELAGIYEITKKYGSNKAKLIEQLKSQTRNFETSPETSELANISRTMVTAITTYFFVNDYTNKVLIESEGKNIDGAREERNERIAHKLSNFVINGTLMNLFNSVFKTQLNNSLIEATLIATGTEMTNEFMVRKSICQPVKRMKSREDIIKYEHDKMSQGGIVGLYHRLFAKITGKKALTQKTDTNKAQKNN